jgi:hypothetical protein
LTSFLAGCAVVLLLIRPAVWAIGLAKRQRGGAVLLTGLFLMFGMKTQITPPPPPGQVEMVQRQADDDKDKDPREPKLPRRAAP